MKTLSANLNLKHVTIALSIAFALHTKSVTSLATSSSRSTMKMSTRTLPPLPSLSDQTTLVASHRFSDYSNWVVPGVIMQGRNPTSGRGSATTRINSIVNEGGCCTFVCLQAESPPQDESCGSCGGSDDWKTNPMNFNSYRDDVIAAAASMDGEVPTPTFVHYGIRDFDVAESIESLSLFIDNLVRRVDQGERLYVHCWGGKGRAGLVSACLLSELYGIDAEESLERTSVYCNLRTASMAGVIINSPETDAQKDQVRELVMFRRNRAREM